MSGAEQEAARWLLSPEAIRARSGALMARIEAGESACWRWDEAAWPGLVSFVAEHIRESYPTLDIPYHGRLRHFSPGALATVASADAAAMLDLIVVSVLLDAGAGDGWRWVRPGDGTVWARSEGLAEASLWMFAQGMFSSVEGEPWRVDAEGLANLKLDDLARGFQLGPDNPMVGLEGRHGVLVALGGALAAKPELFVGGRPSGLLAALAARHPETRTLPAPALLGVVLEGFGGIWPGRTTLGGVNLGDVWRHEAAGGEGPGAGLVPFHKLSQWLTYSLFEPLEQAGWTITDADGMTGLPEYRNGGLLVDMGVLVARDPAGLLAREHATGGELVVEWRAATIVALDRLAAALRAEFGLSAEQFPLVKVLQGGSWSAGRVAAKRVRADGGPPVRVERDGTVF